HCNAGALATGGFGTALGVIRAAREQGKDVKVFIDETRPVLQGARLSSWELAEDGFDVTVICDSMAGALMRKGKIDAVIVGADRIASNGDVANKIGTYTLAVLAKEHCIPFYVAAPWSTFDTALASGEDIVIEERSGEEVRLLPGGQRIPDSVKVWNPAFDVTPAELVTAIISERGVFRAPFDLSDMSEKES
ncbi:MAG TPA: S-methyl-5-thioribose-1-phosphate isomerase, partial [Synergistaceae bacterium]|nr:S-methyl-5-thioribose-1-phosphate isomerase [Synergistaceae bacterium]